MFREFGLWDDSGVRKALPPYADGARVWPVLILAVAVFARLALIIMKGQHSNFADTLEYDAAARSLLAGHGIGGGIPRAPLYPAFMALGYSMFGVGNYAAVRLLQLLPGTGAVLLTMWLGARVGGPTTGLLAGAAAAVAPTLVYTSTMLYPTVIYTFIMVAITAVGLHASRAPGVGAGAVLGGLITLAWFTDQIVVVPVAAVLVWIASATPRRGMLPARAPILAVVVAMCLVVPIARYQHRAHDTPMFFLRKAEYVLYVARHDSSAVGGHALRDTSRTFVPISAREFADREGRLIAQHPGAYLHDYAYEFVHFFNPYPDRIQTVNRFTGLGARWLVAAYFLLVLPLAIGGLCFGAGRARERALLAIVPLATAATYALFFTQVRYRIPTEPMLLVLAAMGAERIARGRARVESSAHHATSPPADPPM